METISAPFSKHNAYSKIKPLHYCPNCNSILHNRIARGWIVKNVFFWLDVKRYRCDKCFKHVYVKSDRNIIFEQ